jgi:hypothetical protein
MSSPYRFWPPGIFDLPTAKPARIRLDCNGGFHHIACTPNGKIMAVTMGWRATIWKFSARH